jgi:transposase
MRKGSKIAEYTYLKRRAIELKEEGMKQVEIVRVLGIGSTTLTTWLKRYKIEGEKYLAPAKLGGHKKSFLKKSEEERLSKILVEKTAEDYGFMGGFWTYERIGLVVLEEFGVSYKKRSIGDLLKRMKFSWQKPQKKVIIKRKRK